MIGADGLHSSSRAEVFGDEAGFTHPLGAAISIFSTPNTFGITDQAVMFNVPGKAVGMYTTIDNQRVRALFLFRGDPRALEGLDQAAQKRVLRTLFADVGWQSRTLLERLDDADDFYFDGATQVRMGTWTKGRVALVGDSAWGPSPLSGQGTTLAIVGAKVLASELAHHGHEEAFRRFEARMRPYVARNHAVANDGMRMLLPSSRLGIGARNLAFRILPWISRFSAGFDDKLIRIATLEDAAR